MNTNPMIGIVILNYKSYELTLSCLKSLEQLDYSNFFVVVVDNNSPNESDKVLKNEIEILKKYSIKIIYNMAIENGGYSSGNNIGIKIAIDNGAKYVLVMNNDVSLDNKDFIKSAVFRMEKNRKISMIGPGIIENEKLQLPIYEKRPTLLSELLKNFFLPFTILFNKYKLINHQQQNKPLKVYSVAGSCFLMRTDHIKNVQYYDENIFLYGEELIIGEKFYKYGYDVLYLPEFKINHMHSYTINNIYKNIEKSKMIDNSLLYYYKNLRRDISKIEYNLIRLSLFVKTNFYLPIIFKLKS